MTSGKGVAIVSLAEDECELSEDPKSGATGVVGVAVRYRRLDWNRWHVYSLYSF